MSEISFNKFHEILFWPLELSGKEHLSETKIDQWVARHNDGHPWKLINPYDRGTAPTGDLHYAEYLYFHPFVRQFLYPSQPGEEHLRILGRDDVRGVEVRFGYEGYQRRLTIDRVHLYVFQTRVAILVVEVEAIEPMPRSEAMAFLEEFRKVYAPYFDHSRAGKCPESVQWLDGSGIPIGDASTLQDPSEQRKSVEASGWRRPPVSAHWRWLLNGLIPSCPQADREDDVLYYDQIEDERMPSMSFLTTDTPHAVTLEDQQRLCFCDEPSSNPEAATYSPEFLSDFVQKHCYDRYWDATNPINAWMTTRFLCSGYGFTFLGQADPKFVENGANGLLAHFRHHYFQLGLIAHFHRASLLHFSRRFSQSVHLITEENEGLNRDFARFVTGYWFNEVSNQMQGSELFHFWSNHLGNQQLLDHVMREKRLALELDEAAKMKDDSTQVMNLTKSMTLLTILLVPLTGASLVIAWFEMEFTRHRFDWLKDGRAWWGWSAAFFASILIFAFVLRAVLMREKKKGKP